jgi:hypothetical protein
MLTALRLRNFKNFEDETLRMGPFTVLVGANASGKSNVRDALRFLHGVGRGYSLADIIGGRYGAGGQEEWPPVRGAIDEIVRFGEDSFRLTVNMKHKWLEDSGGKYFRPWEYDIEIGREAKGSSPFRVSHESLAYAGETTFTSRLDRADVIGEEASPTGRRDAAVRRPGGPGHMPIRVAAEGEQEGSELRLDVNRDCPALLAVQKGEKVARHHRGRAELMQGMLANMRFLDFSPARMRRSAFPGQTVLGDRGDNLPTVLKEICADDKRRRVLVEWARELTPMDVADFEFPVDPTTGRVQLALREAGGGTVSSHAASDGTLRFLGLLAALLTADGSAKTALAHPDRAGLYVLEEIESGIHPSRLRLLVELIESQVAKGHMQVLATTHSPALLSMVNDETFEHTSVVCRCPSKSGAVIRPVAELPDAERLRESQGLGRLHASGWMEHAVSFADNSRTGRS